MNSLKKAIALLLVTILFGGVLSFAVCAQDEDVRALIITDNPDPLWDLRLNRNPDAADYVILTSESVRLIPKLVDVVKAWVQTGKGLILSSESVDLFLDNIKLTESGYRGTITLTRASTADLPLLYGVDAVKFYGPAHNYNGSTLYTYSFELPDSEALIPVFKDSKGNVFVFAYTIGNGHVLVVGTAQLYGSDPLTNAFPDGIDSELFRSNAIKWLGGYGGSLTNVSVPTAAPIDVVKMKNGDTIRGLVSDSSFTLRTPYAKLTLSTKDLLQIVIEGAGTNVDVVTLRAGDRLSGVLENSTVTITLPSKDVVQIGLEQVRSILFAPRE